MKITPKTPTAAILPLLTDDTLTDLLGKVEGNKASRAAWEMTIGEFGRVVDGSFISDIAAEEPLALQWLRKVKAVLDSMESLAKYIEAIAVKQTPEEVAAAKGITPTPLAVRMAIDCVGWFHLRSLAEAEECKVGDWLVMYEDNCKAQQVQRNLNQILSKS